MLISYTVDGSAGDLCIFKLLLHCAILGSSDSILAACPSGLGPHAHNCDDHISVDIEKMAIRLLNSGPSRVQ